MDERVTCPGDHYRYEGKQWVWYNPDRDGWFFTHKKRVFCWDCHTELSVNSAGEPVAEAMVPKAEVERLHEAANSCGLRITHTFCSCPVLDIFDAEGQQVATPMVPKAALEVAVREEWIGSWSNATGCRTTRDSLIVAAAIARAAEEASDEPPV